MSKINIYNEKEIEVLKEGGGILYKILKILEKETLENVSTIFLNCSLNVESFINGVRKFTNVGNCKLNLTTVNM